MKRIEIIVQRDGNVRIETQNFSGPRCQDASRFLEAALGMRTSEQLTAEFYQQTTIDQQNSIEQ